MKRAFDAFLKGVDKWLLRTSFHGGYTYVGSIVGNQFYPEMEQQSCSLASLYALQSMVSPYSRADKSTVKKARALMCACRGAVSCSYTCYRMFKEKPSGLAADRMFFSEEKDFEATGEGARYRLRGEFAEALYHVFKATNDPIYMWEKSGGFME